jgi:hypothetical protein
MKMNYHILLHKLNINNKNISRMNKNFFISKLYIEFFKKVCESISYTCKRKKKLKDIKEYYELNLKSKIFNKFSVMIEVLQKERGLMLQRIIKGKILFLNMKIICVRII